MQALIYMAGIITQQCITDMETQRYINFTGGTVTYWFQWELTIPNFDGTLSSKSIHFNFPCHSFKALDLSGCDLRMPDFELLRKVRFRDVDFSRTMTTDTMFNRLPANNMLKIIDLSNCPITDKALEQIDRFPNLEQLYLRETPITDAALSSVAKLKHLTVLQIPSTNVTDRGLKSLNELHNLVFLDLCDCRVTDTGLSHLTNLTRLGYLDVSVTAVKGLPLDEIIKRNPQLKLINLGATLVTEVLVDTLKRAYPNVDFSGFN